MADDLRSFEASQRRALSAAMGMAADGTADPIEALREAAEAELAAHVAEFGEEEAVARYLLLLEGRALEIASAVMATSAWGLDQRLEFLLSLLADERVAAAAVLPPQRVAVRSLLAQLLPGSCSSCPESEGSRT